MSPNKSTNIIKYCVLTSTAAIVLIATSLIPVSRKAAYWNLCLYKIVRLLNRKVNGLKVWNKALKGELKCQYIVGLFMNLKLK